MGQSTNAIFFYGYVWNDEDTDLGTDDETIVESLAKQVMPNPWDTHDKTTTWLQRHSAEVDAWYELRKEIENGILVTIGEHCSGDYPMPYLALKSTEVTAWRGQSRPVSLALREDADHILVEFANDHAIDLVGAEGPGWFIASYWSH